MVGLETHLRKMRSLLDLDDDRVKMVGISGPAGIGKTTIARALHSLLSSSFQLSCFIDNLRGSYRSGLDEYGSHLRLQEQLLSNILNQTGVKICHLGAIKERLCNQRVLIILDDVNEIKQLEALANDTTWFGLGSRVVVTTEDKELLQQHDIKKTYHVGFPPDEQAIKILYRYAFRQSYPHNGFKKLALRVTELCGKLPLGLRVVGSSLRGKNEEEWEKVICRLDTILPHQDIEEVLRVGYESLDENEKSLFLHIAVFFNSKDGDIVEAMFADNKLDTKHGLEILANKSLICISTDGKIVMHNLLQQVGMKVVREEEPWKQRILINASEICDVLERAKGSRAVSGILFDISNINEVSISERAFERMPDLRFLKVYNSKDDHGNDRVQISEEMEFPRRLRLLHWEAYPSKSLPLTLHPEYLVEIKLGGPWLQKLWEGTLPLTNLKRMSLLRSLTLKELPDLSNIDLWCRMSVNGFPFHAVVFRRLPNILSRHLFISQCEILDVDGWSFKLDTEILFTFSTSSENINIFECGVKNLTEETDGRIDSYGSYESSLEQVSEDDDESLSDGSNESCSNQVAEECNESWSEQVAEDEDEIHSKKKKRRRRG